MDTFCDFLRTVVDLRTYRTLNFLKIIFEVQMGTSFSKYLLIHRVHKKVSQLFFSNYDFKS